MSVDSLREHLFRHQSAQVVSTLTRALGGRHLSLAEEVQDALVTALQQWPYRGVPDDPAGWLFRVARNRALDRLRHEHIVESKTQAALETYRGRPHDPSPAETLLSSEIPPLDDDQLGMMFLTCHQRCRATRASR
jgi:RNA polymerase sigma-70 factor (ECF subfamily)